jgi:AcrR family transcriptional regulator
VLFRSHFSSKEALYEEVCTRILDGVVATVDGELMKGGSPEERLERFVSTMFDAFCRDNNTLLVLTQRDVINATIFPQRSFASPHHRLFLGLIHKLLSQYFGNEIDGALSYAFESMLFGYCSLLVYSHRDSGRTWEEHRSRRKAELLGMCRTFLHAETRNP